jgi:prepilin-type N-terminal cleavage/methylation domain-containing protein
MFKKAFTLIEMLVTITIISILAGFVIVKINDSANLAKDTQRKADINLLANSVVSYSADNYSSKPITDENGCTIGGGTDQCSTEIENALKAYLPTLPKEPNSNAYYIYWSNGTDCTVTANLSSSNTEDAYVYSCTPDVALAGDSVNGTCGTTANTSATGYASSIADWPTSNFCSTGTLYTTPTWPAQGTSVSWTCVGEYLGNNITCTAYRAQDGVCGTREKRYADAATSYGTDTICSIGTGSPASPAFPVKGASTTWSCLGVNNGTTDTCVAEHTGNAVCGTANRTTATAYADAATSYGTDTFCTLGTTTTPAFPAKGASQSWTCAGLLGGTNASCISYHSKNAACGTAVRTFADAESSYGSYTFCSAGTTATPAFPAKGASTTWTCAGVYTGTSISCTAQHSLNGVCGTNAQAYASGVTAYSGTFCAAGTANPTTPAFPASGASVTWTCLGALSGTNASCTASRAGAPVAGTCGTSAQTCDSIALASAPTTNLCATGTASAVAGTGPWTWTCAGLYGGATSGTCTAYKANLCNSQHASEQCACKGGTVVSVGSCSICKLGNACSGGYCCPSGWTRYQNYSEARGACYTQYSETEHVTMTLGIACGSSASIPNTAPLGYQACGLTGSDANGCMWRICPNNGWAWGNSTPAFCNASTYPSPWPYSWWQSYGSTCISTYCTCCPSVTLGCY